MGSGWMIVLAALLMALSALVWWLGTLHLEPAIQYVTAAPW